MQVSKETIGKLAEAWLAEAKRLRSSAICDCGCGQEIPVARRARFKQGHDSKLKAEYRKKIRAIITAQ